MGSETKSSGNDSEMPRRRSISSHERSRQPEPMRPIGRGHEIHHQTVEAQIAAGVFEWMRDERICVVDRRHGRKLFLTRAKATGQTSVALELAALGILRAPSPGSRLGNKEQPITALPPPNHGTGPCRTKHLETFLIAESKGPW